MKSYLSRKAGCCYRQTAGSWNILDTLAYVMICNHWSVTRRYRTFHDVPMNRGVSTEDYRGLTSYRERDEKTEKTHQKKAQKETEKQAANAAKVTQSI
jgi:hypothetical protein